IKFNSLKFLGIFSHLFSATYTDGLEVIKKFTEVVSKLGRDNFEMVHLQNAAGIYNYDVDVVTHIRTGMLTYGLQEAGFYDHDLKPVFTGLIGFVDSVRYVSELDYVAYEDLSSISPKTKKIAKIKIGYGDGFPKANNKTTCLIKKKEYVISQVTMDNTFIEVDDRVNVGDKVREATELVKAQRPDLLVEGPIQYDAAVDATVAKQKMPDSPVAGQATVLIFPDLNAGNITYKAVQRETHSIAIGPMLQGLRKPVNDLSRGATVADIYNTVLITAIQAGMQE
ncbi:phosphate acyltransferase, partial [Capnocytophaga granulosa]|uniref:phosphate acyltransferase n=1 Tax=Capnocytophaga granulosa TaxID=45242 RepID=UPI00361F1C97